MNMRLKSFSFFMLFILIIFLSASYGNFAFYKIPEKGYYLKVLKGKKVLDQLEGDKKIKRRLVKVVDQSTRLPDIIILP